MYFKSVDATTKDVFLGNKGWDLWTRYQLVEGKWRRINGLRVDSDTHHRIVDRLEYYRGNVRKNKGDK